MNNEIGILDNFTEILARFFKPSKCLNAGETSIIEFLWGRFSKVLIIRHISKFSLYFQLSH